VNGTKLISSQLHLFAPLGKLGKKSQAAAGAQSMKSELIVRRAGEGHYNVIDPADPSFVLKEISDTQLLGYLRNRRVVGTTAEEVLRQFDLNAARSEVHVTIDRSL